MKQNFDPSPQTILSQKPNKFHFWVIVISSIVSIGLVVGAVIYSSKINNQQISNVISTPTLTDNSTTSISNSESNNENLVDVVKSDTYTYEGKTLYYVQNDNLRNHFPHHYVTVYLSDGGVETEIIHEFPLFYNEMPKFEKTSKPNIVLLKTRFGDMGALIEEYYYIDVLTKKVINVTNFNRSFLKITEDNKQTFEIGLSITDNCGIVGENRREDMYATLEDITVNDKLQNVITQIRLLKCVDPGGIGSIYSPSPKIRFLGVSNNLSKVFFLLSGNDETVSWENNFSFDLGNKTVKEEDPVDIL
jgi:hypothetical protein